VNSRLLLNKIASPFDIDYMVSVMVFNATFNNISLI